MPLQETTDCLVVGGGVIGLSIAYELAFRGRTVTLLERGQLGREASWAGAGILPPGSWYSDHSAVEQLARLSHPLNRLWSERLHDEAGVDDEYSACGAIYPIDSINAEKLSAKFSRWRAHGVESERCNAAEAAAVAPALNLGDAFYVPDEAQVRNPRRLAALATACELLGVVIQTNAPAERFRCDGDRLVAIETPCASYTADQFVLAAGAWTSILSEQLAAKIPTRPVRGQMLLLRSPEQHMRCIYHRDGKYLVPRRDGRVLVGATVEEVGFDKSTQPVDINALLEFACEAAPGLRDASVEASWAGLRPAGGDELPSIGLLPGMSNAWVASGHYRSGLQFAPATAVLLRQLLDDEPTEMDVSPFSPERFVMATR